MSEIALKRIQKEQQEKTGKLDLTGLSLIAIPKEIKGMSWLTSLYLHNNKIKKIENLDTLNNLNLLSLHTNQIVKIEGLKGLKGLKMLYLYGNQITKIEGLEDLKTISVLYLNANQITKIEGLKSLVHLSMLNLFNNKITKIEKLEGLNNLSFLYLHHNPILKIEGIEQLTALTIFSFGSKKRATTFDKYIFNNIPVIYLNGMLQNFKIISNEVLNGRRLFWESPKINLEKSESLTAINFLLNNQKVHCKKGIYLQDCNELEHLKTVIQQGHKALVEYLHDDK